MSTQPFDSARNNDFDRQASLYSLAAAVAGVSVLALAQPAASEVVVTRKTIPIPMTPFGMPDPVAISLANNGINDFAFRLYNNNELSFRFLQMYGARYGDGLMVEDVYNTLALPRGAKIGPPFVFLNYGYPIFIEGSQTHSSGQRAIFGYWPGNLKNHYLGVRFPINGQTHYGWIRLTVTTNPQAHGPMMTAKITGYAYETIPKKPILAGTAKQPTANIQVPQNIQDQIGPSLGVLALGSEGLPLWRREETSGLQ